MRERLVTFEPLKKCLVLWAKPLTEHATYQTIVGGRVYPVRKRMIRRPFIMKYQALFGTKKKTFRSDRSGGTFGQADTAVLALFHHAWLAPGIFLTR